MTDKTPDIDPEAKREELIEDAEQAKAERDQQYADLINAVQNDEELTHGGSEWVELGDAGFEVRTEMRGDVLDVLEQFNADDPSEQPSLRELIDAAKKQTVAIRFEDIYLQDSNEIGAFFDEYYNAHGAKVVEAAIDRIFDPALESMDQMTPKSFQSEQRSGASNRAWDVDRP